MSATMFVEVRPDGYGKRTFITVPFIGALATPDPGEQQKYYVLEAVKPAPRKGVNQHTGGSDIVKPSKGGNSADYLAARLARDFPELSARTLLPKRDKDRLSIRAAAIAAGIVKPDHP